MILYQLHELLMTRTALRDQLAEDNEYLTEIKDQLERIEQLLDVFADKWH